MSIITQAVEVSGGLVCLISRSDILAWLVDGLDKAAFLLFIKRDPTTAA